MSAQAAQNAGSAANGDALRDWEALRDAGDIQFAPVPPTKPPETPEWLQWLGEHLRDLLEPLGRALGMSWPVMKYALLALLVVLVAYFLWNLVVVPLLERAAARRPKAQEAAWTPGRGAALALLEDADRLAAEGRFDEAVHLLLQRSVSHIAEARPDWLHPASTAREIAAFPMLPDGARKAFALIALRVERAFFALRGLDAGDWQAARAAYADFALADLAGQAGAS